MRAKSASTRWIVIGCCAHSRARESFATARSDLLTDCRAYEAATTQRTKGGNSAVRQFCDQVSVDCAVSDAGSDGRISSVKQRCATSLRSARTSCLRYHNLAFWVPPER